MWGEPKFFERCIPKIGMLGTPSGPAAYCGCRTSGLLCEHITGPDRVNILRSVLVNGETIGIFT